LLYKKKIITKEQLIEDLQNILAHRHWLNSALWKYALHTIKDM